MKKKTNEAISNYFRGLQKKSWEARKKKLLLKTKLVAEANGISKK